MNSVNGTDVRQIGTVQILFFISSVAYNSPIVISTPSLRVLVKFVSPNLRTETKRFITILCVSTKQLLRSTSI